MLERALRSYRNRAIETAQVIEELIKLARDMRQAQARGEKLGLTEDELAFYEALGVNDAAVMVMGDKVLRVIAKELTDTIRQNVSIDWTQRETAQAKLRTMVRRLLTKARVPTRQAGAGHPDGHGAGGAALRDLGRGWRAGDHKSSGAASPRDAH